MAASENPYKQKATDFQEWKKQHGKATDSQEWKKQHGTELTAAEKVTILKVKVWGGGGARSLARSYSIQHLLIDASIEHLPITGKWVREAVVQAVLEGTKNGVAKAVLLDAKSMALVEVCDSICGRYFTDDDVIPPNYFLKAEMDMMAAYSANTV